MNIYIYVDDIRKDDSFLNQLPLYENQHWDPIICRTAEQATLNFIMVAPILSLISIMILEKVMKWITFLLLLVMIFVSIL